MGGEVVLPMSSIKIRRTSLYGAYKNEVRLQVLWSRAVTVLTHIALGALLLTRARQTNLEESKSVYSCYMFVWKLFYAEYLLIPLLR